MCRTGCPTQTCGSYAACLKGAGIRIAYSNSARGLDATAQKRWDKELSDYRDARAQGIQPATTRTADIRKAVDRSNELGRAVDTSKEIIL